MDLLKSRYEPWLLTAALLAAQLSIAQTQPSLERKSIDSSFCTGCATSPPRSDALSGIAYSGRLYSEAGVLAVLVRNGRDQIVAVGDVLDEEWKIITIDTEAVSLRHVTAGLHRRLWLGGGASQMEAEGPASPGAVARLNWKSPTRVQPGSEFSITLFVRGVEVRRGAITLQYDPAVLSVVDATGEWEDYPGSTRLLMKDIGDGEDLAEVVFRVVAQAPTRTRLRVRQMELVDAGGASVPTPPADDMRIDIAAASQNR